MLTFVCLLVITTGALGALPNVTQHSNMSMPMDSSGQVTIFMATSGANSTPPTTTAILNGTFASTQNGSTDGHFWPNNQTARLNISEFGRDVLKSDDFSIRDDPPAQEANEATTAAALENNILKYGLIGAAVLVPLVLLPVLFLFSRGGKTNEKGDEQIGPESMTKDLVALQQPITLMPVALGNDPYLEHSPCSTGPDGLVVKNSFGQLMYNLSPNVTFVVTATQQLYHPPSGLLFNPVPDEAFDVATGQMLNQSGNLPPISSSNLVYDVNTCQVYERCLSVSYMDGPDGFQWYSAPSLVALDGKQAPIRRARIDELPSELAQLYSKLPDQLCAKNDQTFHKVSGNATQMQQQQQKVGATTSTAVPINPLLLTLRDFSKMQPYDMAPTPRGSTSSWQETTLYEDTNSALA